MSRVDTKVGGFSQSPCATDRQNRQRIDDPCLVRYSLIGRIVRAGLGTYVRKAKPKVNG